MDTVLDTIPSRYLMIIIILFLLLLSKFRLKQLLLIYLFLFPFNYWTSIGPLNLNLNELLIFILFFLWSIGFLVKGKANFKLKDKTNPFKKWMFLYSSFSFVLLLNSSLGDKSTYKAIARPIELSMLFFVMASVFVYRDINLEKISRLLLSSATIVCLLGIIEFSIYNISFPQSFVIFHQKMISLGIYPPRPLKEIFNFALEGKTIGSTFASKSALSIYLSVVLPLIIIKILFKKGLFGKIKLIFLFILSALNLFLTGSRTGLITVSLGILIILYVLKIKKFSYIALSIILGILIFSYLLPPALQKRLIFLSHESSIISREVYMKRSIQIIKNNPLIGAGVDSIGSEDGKSKPHNAYLSEFQTKGIFAFLIISSLFLSAVKNSYNNLKLMAINKKDDPFLLWSFVVIMIYLFTSFAAEPFHENQTSVLFILGLVISSKFLNSSITYEQH